MHTYPDLVVYGYKDTNIISNIQIKPYLFD